MLADLKEERERIDEAILAMERLSLGAGKRKGRPPAWLSALNAAQEDSAPAKRGRKPARKPEE